MVCSTKIPVTCVSVFESSAKKSNPRWAEEPMKMDSTTGCAISGLTISLRAILLIFIMISIVDAHDGYHNIMLTITENEGLFCTVCTPVTVKLLVKQS